MTLPASDSVFPDRFRRRLQVVLTQRLPELLRYEDRNSMAHSIEARLPFLDYRLVELMFSVDPRNLISEGRAKVILRESLADLLPESVRGRTDKVGFDTPEATVADGPARQLRARRSHQPRLPRARLDRRRSRRGEPATGTPARRDRRSGARLCLELWAQTFVDGSPAPRARERDRCRLSRRPTLRSRAAHAGQFEKRHRLNEFLNGTARLRAYPWVM